jgi:hypothetical protein
MLQRLATDRSLGESDRIRAISELTANDRPSGLDLAAAVALDASEPVELRYRMGFRLAISRARRYREIGLAALADLVTRTPAGPGYYDESVGRLATRTLAEYGGPADRALLARVCSDESARPSVRSAAAAALYHHGTAADRDFAIARLKAFAVDPAAELLDRDGAAEILSSHGDRAALTWLRELTNDDDPATRYVAAQALVDTGPVADRPVARQVLLSLVTDPAVDGVLRLMAAQRVTMFGTNAERSVLADLLRDPDCDDETRLYAASGLGQSRYDDLRALGDQTLVGLATDPGVDMQVRFDALERLAWHGTLAGLRHAAAIASDPQEDPVMRMAAARVVLTHERPATAADAERAALAEAALAATAEVLESGPEHDDLAGEAAILLVAGGGAEGIARALRIAGDPSFGPRSCRAAGSAVCQRGSAADRAAVVELLHADGLSAATRVAFAEALLDAPEEEHTDAARAALAGIAVDAGTPARVRRDALFELTYTVTASTPVLLDVAEARSAPAAIRCDAAAAVLKAGAEAADNADAAEAAADAERILLALARNPFTDWWTGVDVVIALDDHRPAALSRLAALVAEPSFDPIVRAYLCMRMAGSEDESLARGAVEALRGLANDPDGPLEPRAIAARWLAGAGPDELAGFAGAPAYVRAEAAAGLAASAAAALAAATEAAADDAGIDLAVAADTAAAWAEAARLVLTAIAGDDELTAEVRGLAAVRLVEHDLVPRAWISEQVASADHPYVRFTLAAAAAESTMDDAVRDQLLAAVHAGARAWRGDRRWIWAGVTLAQYGSAADGFLAQFADEPGWAAFDPLVHHLTETDWLSGREDKPRDALERELMKLLDMPDGNHRLRQIAAYELTLNGWGHWRVLARAVLDGSDPYAAEPDDAQ